MKKTTLINLILLTFTMLMGNHGQAQEPANQTIAIPVEGDQATAPRNTFIDYHFYITENEEFRFRKELKKVKEDTDYLEYASEHNNIRISKYDYLKLMRRAVNQSETKTEFMNHINSYFVDTDDQFAQQVDFESVYDATRNYTFYGYFDGLPRIHN